MTILSTLSTPTFNDNFIQHLIAIPLPASADLFEVADLCAPDSWQNTATPVSYAQALVQAIRGTPCHFA